MLTYYFFRKGYLKHDNSLEDELPAIRKQAIEPDPILVKRKIGSVDCSKRDEINKRIAELYKAHPMKSPVKIQVLRDKDKANPLYGNRPPLPAKNDKLIAQHYVSPNPMRQAGLAVLERPQHYVAPRSYNYK